MQEVYKILIGIGVLALGIPIGALMARFTKEELKVGRPWFKTIIFLGIIGAIISLIFRNDVFFFSCVFIATVTGMNIRPERKQGKRKSRFRRKQ